MTKRNENETNDDLPIELRKALIECGAIIPTTPEEVALAEKHLKIKTTPSEIDAAFRKLEQALDDPDSEISFMKLNASFEAISSEDLAVAARCGTELDTETRAKIEETINKVLQKPPQDTSK